ncbi:hypothetical protein MUK42_27873 [Musa troglodytarum]|uniref:NAC domain-containing protein n=1 Tax=Musa troglodytarum TaxID=320322 RepID=A0A9E7F2H0_9LILI|nr:hypothetical protein MUK42_27873 [Musa troglodytarum]
MHEYRLHPSLYETIPSYETEEIILCRIQHKGRGAADKSDDATEQVAWMTAAPAIQGAMADVFGCYRVPDTGVLGKEPSCGVPLRRQKRGLAMTFLDFMTTSTLQRRPHL